MVLLETSKGGKILLKNGLVKGTFHWNIICTVINSSLPTEKDTKLLCYFIFYKIVLKLATSGA